MFNSKDAGWELSADCTGWLPHAGAERPATSKSFSSPATRSTYLAVPQQICTT